MTDLKNIKRLKLGIIFNFSSSWMGGVIYILNIIKILGSLNDKDKPEIFLFYRPELERFISEINYPYLNPLKWSFPPIIKGNIMSFLLRKNIFIHEIIKKYSLNAIFPMHDFPVKTKTKTKQISWWADLQHKYYPEFFSKAQIAGRNLRTRLIIKNSDALVVSSKAVLDDFHQFYKIRKDLKIHIFHFISVIDNHEPIDIDVLRTKYNLPSAYFLVSNQFHKHKNHKVVLLSLVNLKKKGVKIHVAFTGKYPKNSDSPYISELNKIIEENNLQDQVTLLGVISRNEQLELMRHSQAVIQPSLFEGWSTVIEDARSLQVPAIASSLNVNIEQLGETGNFFDPHDPEKLAIILENYPLRNLKDIFYEEYSKRVKNAANELLAIFNTN